MSTLAVREHASWYHPHSNQQSQAITAEAYQKAIDDLKTEVRIAGGITAFVESATTIHDILTTVKTVKHTYEDTSKESTGARQWIEKLSGSIMHYGRVFDTLAQHHPEYVALAWGAVKLVLMGIIERATLVQELAQAIVAIGDVLPQASLSAELYQTEHMKEALARLYTYIMRFLYLCVKWYSRGSLGRFVSALKSPFKLDYKDLVDHIKACSATIADLANSGARTEIRDIRTIQAIHHAQFMELHNKLLEKQNWVEHSLVRILQTTTASRAINERVSFDVQAIRRTASGLELHHVVQFFAPQLLPDKVLLKVQSFARRNPTPTFLPREDLKIKRKLQSWATSGRSELLVFGLGLGARKQARELAADVVQSLKTGDQIVFWDLGSEGNSVHEASMSETFKRVIYQALQYSTGLFAEVSEELSLEKIHGVHTDSEWAELICLLFSKIPRAYVVIETDELHRAHRHDLDWASRSLRLLQTVVDRSTAAGNHLKVLVIVCGNVRKTAASAAERNNMTTVSLPSSAPVPPRLRHITRSKDSKTRKWRLQARKL